MAQQEVGSGFIELTKMMKMLARAEAVKKKRMTSPGDVALGCDRCASGSLVAHPRGFEL